MKEPCCSVGMSGTDSLPNNYGWHVWWLPKGYGPGLDDFIVCFFPQREEFDGYSFKKGDRPPLIEAVVAAIEKHYRSNPPIDAQ